MSAVGRFTMLHRGRDAPRVQPRSKSMHIQFSFRGRSPRRAFKELFSSTSVLRHPVPSGEINEIRSHQMKPTRCLQSTGYNRMEMSPQWYTVDFLDYSIPNKVCE
jgi:hypothetical protein